MGLRFDMTLELDLKFTKPNCKNMMVTRPIKLNKHFRYFRRLVVTWQFLLDYLIVSSLAIISIPLFLFAVKLCSRLSFCNGLIAHVTPMPGRYCAPMDYEAASSDTIYYCFPRKLNLSGIVKQTRNSNRNRCDKRCTVPLIAAKNAHRAAKRSLIADSALIGPVRGADCTTDSYEFPRGLDVDTKRMWNC